MKKYELFIESIASPFFTKEIEDIKAFNEQVDRDEILRIEASFNQIKREKKAAPSSVQNSLQRGLRRGSKYLGDANRSSNPFLTGVLHADHRSRKRNDRYDLSRKNTNEDVGNNEKEAEKSAKSEVNEKLLEEIEVKSMRLLTELYPNADDFSDLVFQGEEECLNLIEAINILEEENQRVDKNFGPSLKSLEKEKHLLEVNLNQMAQVKEGLAEQIELRMDQLKTTKNTRENHTPELNDKDKFTIYVMIFKLANEMGLVEKKDKKVEDLTFEEVIDYLKDITFMHNDFVKFVEEYKNNDKKEFERDSREYNKLKREKMRVEQEERDYAEQKIIAEMKVKKDIEIQRKLKGRKDVTRVWMEKEKVNEEMTKLDLVQKEEEYYKSNNY